MRLVKVKGPEGSASELARIAFDAGISHVAVHQETIYHSDNSRELRDVVDVGTATPKAKKLVDDLMAKPYFDPEQYSIQVRQPRTVVSSEKPWKVTWPLVEPTTDILEELWQYSHVTPGFIARCLVAAALLAFGMIQGKLLLILAGLLFYPLLHATLAVAFGLWTRTWRLAAQGGYALTVGMTLGVVGGITVAALTKPPMQFQESSTLLTAAAISLIVGIAAGFATGDDAGERSLIGLAATAQIAMHPVWFGIFLLFGKDQVGGDPAERLLHLAVNLGCLIAGAFAIYALLRFKGEGLRHFVFHHLRRTEKAKA